MDAGLAKVLNSTVGTSDFKPLDEVLDDKVRLIVDDTLYYTYDGAWTKKNEDSTTISRTSDPVEIPYDGTISVEYGAHNDNGQFSKDCTVDIYKDGKKVWSGQMTIPPDGSETISREMNVTRGQQIHIKCIKNSATTLSERFFRIFARPVFGSKVCQIVK